MQYVLHLHALSETAFVQATNRDLRGLGLVADIVSYLNVLRSSYLGAHSLRLRADWLPRVL